MEKINVNDVLIVELPRECRLMQIGWLSRLMPCFPLNPGSPWVFRWRAHIADEIFGIWCFDGDGSRCLPVSITVTSGGERREAAGIAVNGYALPNKADGILGAKIEGGGN